MTAAEASHEWDDSYAGPSPPGTSAARSLPSSASPTPVRSLAHPRRRLRHRRAPERRLGSPPGHRRRVARRVRLRLEHRFAHPRPLRYQSGPRYPYRRSLESRRRAAGVPRTHFCRFQPEPAFQGGSRSESIPPGRTAANGGRVAEDQQVLRQAGLQPVAIRAVERHPKERRPRRPIAGSGSEGYPISAAPGSPLLCGGSGGRGAGHATLQQRSQVRLSVRPLRSGP